MTFWDIFKNKNISSTSRLSGLHEKLSSELPNAAEDELIEIACIAGLLARVAYVDFDIDTREIYSMKNILLEWTDLPDKDIDAIVHLAIEEIKELAGLENHKYCHPLNDILSNDQKYGLLKALFAVAASDHHVEQIENEEIRVICRGLRLQHNYYVSARASVLEKLGALKK